ncbi:metallophosphoesterase family protein [Acidobacteriota bacterium]
MKYLILSDIHSNLEALEATLAHAGRIGFDKVALLGDLVGYGASPNEAVEIVRSFDAVWEIRGNHDKVVSLIDNGEQFNIMARSSCEWTRKALEDDNLEYVKSLQQGPVGVEDTFFLSHGTPLDEDAYILTDLDALEVFRFFPHRICFYGHSHIPLFFTQGGPNGIVWDAPGINEDEKTMDLDPDMRYLLNPGSVGQPRDRNPKASYCIFDSEGDGRVTLYRVEYDIKKAQDKIVQAGLPKFLAERLALGV